jgi:DNA (cytosine-5)-methyltransferase 1
MGYPDSYKIATSMNQAYKQFGNSVAIPAIQATAENELKTIGLI